MAIPEEKLKKLKLLLEVANDGLTTEEFVKAFEAIKEHFLRTEIKLVEKFNKAINELKNELRGENNTLNKTSEALLSDLTAELNKDMAQALKSQKTSLDFIRDKVRKVKSGDKGEDGLDGLDGRDADEEKIVKEIMDKIKLPELDMSILEKIKEDIEELKERPIGRVGGGGFSKIAMDGHIVDWTHFGTGDDSTVKFTLPVSPNPILSLQLMVGGSELFVTDDWTLSGLDVTFLIAPPTGAKLRYKCRK